MTEEFKNYASREPLSICLSSNLSNDILRFNVALGVETYLMGRVRYLNGSPPPEIIQNYSLWSGYIGNKSDWESELKGYLIRMSWLCLEYIRDYNWQSKILFNADSSLEFSEIESLVGFIHLPNLNDRKLVEKIVDTISLVPDYPHVVAVQKSDVKHDWHKDYDMLSAPDILTYSLDDIESVAEVYRTLVHKMPLSDEDKQGFLDCIEWQIKNNDLYRP